MQIGTIGLTLHDAETFSEPAPEAIPWIRKRDGSVVAFDPGKLAGTIFAAQQRVDGDNPAFLSQELTQAVLHFLAEEYVDRIPTTQEVSETVVQVLREMGHSAAASVYFNRAEHRRRLRERSRFVASSDGSASDRSAAASVGWDKGRVVAQLESEAELDAETAREIATAVERRLLASELSYLTASLVDELVYCELLERGIERRWSRRLPLGVSADAIQQWIRTLESPGMVVRQIGERVLERFSLREVYSRDVAGLFDEGLLRSLGGQSPIHWSARVVSVHRSGGATETTEILDREWQTAAGQSDHVLVLDSAGAVEGAGSTKDPDRWVKSVARRVGEILGRTVAAGSQRIVVRISEEASRGARKATDERHLFGDEEAESRRARAATFGLELASRIGESAGLADRVRFDLHVPGNVDADRVSVSVAELLPLVRTGFSLCVAVDRDGPSLLEGMSGAAHPTDGIVQYVGIDLGAILDRHDTVDADTFLRRLMLVVDSAVRAGVQRREFLRRATRSGEDGVVVLVPLGLEFVTERLTHRGPFEDEAASAFAVQLLRRLRERAMREAKPYQLTCCVDGVPFGASLGDPPDEFRSESAALQRQLSSLGRLHEAAGGGSSLVRLGEDWKDAAVARFIGWVSARTECRRIVFVGPRPARQAKLFE